LSDLPYSSAYSSCGARRLAQETRFVRHGTHWVANAASGAIERDPSARIDVLERLARNVHVVSVL
jgi:hypothetical protein